MKISLVLKSPGPLSREAALTCLTANLALPGAGSLAAGRRSGYGELVLCFIGTVLTLVFGVRAVVWYFSNWEKIRSPEADPVYLLQQMWLNFRWALLGIAIFGVAWLWSLQTSLSILRFASRPRSAVPPPLL